MINTVTDYLDRTTQLYPNKIAFSDQNREITFIELRNEARHIATGLIEKKYIKKPVAIYMDKCIDCIAAFEGVAYSGNFYCPLDTKMPTERIEKIMSRLKPAAIITDINHKSEVESWAGSAAILCYEDMMSVSIDDQAIDRCMARLIDMDILLVLFTSGSTGTPKGVIISHKSMIDFSEWIASTLEIGCDSVLANQAPFYFILSACDIYQTIRTGCTTHIIPQQLFSFPPKLMTFLEEKEVDTIFWVPSILSFVSIMKAVNRPHLSSIRKIAFAGEVMPIKHLNKWIDEYPEVRFWNLFGQTEVTGACAAYEVNRKFDESDSLPIGHACANVDTFLLDEDDNLVVQVDEIGEICVRGTSLAYGYYNDEEKTRQVFVQNPLNDAYNDIIYRTGDLAKYNDFGELVYVCRKDYQIKHKGHRIELGEIETATSSIEGVEEQCCIYDAEKLKIILFYVGTVDEECVHEKLERIIPEYMMPALSVKIEKMPKNLSGKTDRQKLAELLK